MVGSPKKALLFCIASITLLFEHSCNLVFANTASVQMNSRLLFSYGSNSIAQLRARIENPHIVATPAKACEWQRIFCVRANPAWGGAFASLVRDKHCVTFGSVVSITDEELSKLDKYETGYHKEDLSVSIWVDNDWQSTAAIAYIADHPFWTDIQPSCLRAIDIHGLFSVSDGVDKLLLVDRWTYPGLDHLSLPALCVEVNCRRANKWVMPRAIVEVRRELAAADVHSLGQLSLRLSTSCALGTSMDPSMNHMDVEACAIFKELLRID